MFGEVKPKFVGLKDSVDQSICRRGMYEWDILTEAEADERVAKLFGAAMGASKGERNIGFLSKIVTDIGTDPRDAAAPRPGTAALPPEEAAKPPEPPPGHPLAA